MSGGEQNMKKQNLLTDFFENLDDKKIAHKLYKGINKEMREPIFKSKGIFTNIILLVATELYGKPKGYTKEELLVSMEIYEQVWVRKHSPVSNKLNRTDAVKNQIYTRFDFIDKISLGRAVDICLDFIYATEPKFKEQDLMLETIESTVKEHSAKNIDIEKKYIRDDEYGKSPLKPVFVNGFGPDREYLEHLYTEQMEKLQYTRNGSMQISGISGSVDEYSLSVDGKTEFAKIYICNYGNETSQIAPKGLLYK